jgi:uncharacterized Rossmann fold enzyme
MDYDDWAPIYAAIRADFGFDLASDERARDVLAALLDDSCPDEELSILTDATVAVVAPGPSLSTELADGGQDDADSLATADRVADALATTDRVVAVSDAAATLRERGITVDCHVTDLDGAPLVARELSHEGVPVAVHAHGDNLPALRRHVPSMRQDRVYPTAQVPPAGSVRAPGGFTDGDRAAVLADRWGASALRFVGWDLADPSVGSAKRRKLDWAARILAWLERRRGERYQLLDGMRGSLEALPFE